MWVSMLVWGSLGFRVGWLQKLGGRGGGTNLPLRFVPLRVGWQVHLLKSGHQILCLNS